MDASLFVVVGAFLGGVIGSPNNSIIRVCASTPRPVTLRCVLELPDKPFSIECQINGRRLLEQDSAGQIIPGRGFNGTAEFVHGCTVKLHKPETGSYSVTILPANMIQQWAIRVDNASDCNETDTGLDAPVPTHNTTSDPTAKPPGVPVSIKVLVPLGVIAIVAIGGVCGVVLHKKREHRQKLGCCCRAHDGHGRQACVFKTNPRTTAETPVTELSKAFIESSP